ncbi:MAG: hypothetical protein AAFU80_25900 [Pseudomonadota bacterium]
MAIRDEILVWNERVKLFAQFLNALSLGMIGFAILRPATESFRLVGLEAWLWGALGLLIHGCAHYILGKLRKDERP